MPTISHRKKLKTLRITAHGLRMLISVAIQCGADAKQLLTALRHHDTKVYAGHGVTVSALHTSAPEPGNGSQSRSFCLTLL